MIEIHLLSRLSSERMSLHRNKYRLNEYSLTISEAQLFDHINKFHSNKILSNNNNSQLDSISLTPFNSFIQFYQLINSNQLCISAFNKSIPGMTFYITITNLSHTKSVTQLRKKEYTII